MAKQKCSDILPVFLYLHCFDDAIIYTINPDLFISQSITT